MVDVDWSVSVLLIFFCVAFVAGWVDTLAGGGGLIALPALLLAGVPPVNALATNKSQGVVGTLTSTLTLFFKGHLRGRHLLWLMLMAAIGSALGTLLVQHIDTDWLSWFIPVLLILVALYFLLTPKLGEMEAEARMSEGRWAGIIVPLLGFYDGVFGPGTGSLFAASGVAFRGQTLLTATIRAKLLNFTTNVTSLALFAAGGQVVWVLGGAMMAGQVAGAYIGSHTMLAGGARLIRPLVITICLLMSLSQIADHFGWLPWQ
ncbi:TSUP family transporter [Saccharospirillum sp. HFRX-1]|uniref:TSUP family transporter n=1 Tax=unclassified Saccharospirillum TaxID=2633430 RepID=UPI0037152E35